MAKKKKTEAEEQAFFEEIIESVDTDKTSVSPASLPEVNIAAGKKVPAEPEDSNRKIKMDIIDQIEKINNRYYLLIVKKYIDNLGV